MSQPNTRAPCHAKSVAIMVPFPQPSPGAANTCDQGHFSCQTMHTQCTGNLESSKLHFCEQENSGQSNVGSSDDKILHDVGYWRRNDPRQPDVLLLEGKERKCDGGIFSYPEEVLACLGFARPVEICLPHDVLVGVAGASRHRYLWTVPSEQRKDPRREHRYRHTL